MKPHRRKTLGIIIFIAIGLSATVGLIFFALGQNINMFYTPTQVAEGEVETGQSFRIGGMVKEGSVAGEDDSLRIEFVTTDYVSDVPIHYEGILPDLFREGQGIVAEGSMDLAGVFQADRVLAKHDENFMSPEVKAALDAAGATSENHAELSGN
ncbi:MAG: cytochrome c maturation protein CcmE [Gammaproteobacteria bacterium]|jgi:cytochrome c-type biogenesis protein CcmE|nr:cytochrome c maturation protein CcmE [Gammaproteobacteria bacterium]MBT3859547.1 cytochrome c maturation protein CcmE [Gammaproteobacteria bacterium]MBT3986559.1 cytochrome c maturation protein CcmE [Gammaproteobacteria bacterium]MBT4256295.1 cytochrome c maturation protein CcmE [Gammaproteobacteria bacterium]MBT4581097.1 cytochrome c maturation protein CcmE [Gammaproteobacteria bacterium]